MSFERLTCGWRMRIGRLAIVWGRYNLRRYRLLRGYTGWALHIGRLVVGTLGG